MDYNFDQLPEPRACGRPTLAKTPCTLNVELFAPGCARHASEEELKEARLVLRAWRGGFRSGRRQSTDHLESEIEKLRNEVRQLQRATERMYDGPDQIVVINDDWAYRWAGFPDLEVGEEVMVPANEWSRKRGYPGDWPGVVTALGTRLPGPLRFLISRRSVTHKVSP